jgi:two-component system OmpR family sensor kinase
MTMVLKNLIDNAMKYTNNYPIKIETFNNRIYIKNLGNKLHNDLIYYTRPFTRDPNQQLGHGLGLNIVNKIVKMHNFTLDYDYKDSYNIFIITFK